MKSFLMHDNSNMHVQHLDLSGNQLSGEVPYNLWRSDLHMILFTDNHLTGAIPMLRPSCEHWVGSMQNIRSAQTNGIQTDWREEQIMNFVF